MQFTLCLSKPELFGGVMFKYSLFFALLGISACSSIPQLQPELPPFSTANDLTLLPEQVQSFVLQKLKERGKTANPPLSASDWYHHPPLTGMTKTPDLTISDVLFNGQSIQGPLATAVLQPTWEDAPLELRITGNFENKKDKDLALKSFLFTLEPSVLVRSMAPNENEPNARVLLNDAILLTPTAVSGNEIRVQLPQAGIPDLYLKGLHKLTVIKNRYYFDTQIKVGTPLAAPQAGVLTPHFDKIEVVRNHQGKPRFLRCTGKGLMLTVKFSYAEVDSAFAFGYQSQIVQDEATTAYETLIHIPDPDSFDLNSQHTLTYATPFGTTFQQF